MRHQIGPDEHNERVRLLVPELQKLLNAHTDSLDAESAMLVRLDAAAQVFAGAAIDSQAGKDGPSSRLHIEQRLERFPWASTLDFLADRMAP